MLNTLLYIFFLMLVGLSFWFSSAVAGPGTVAIHSDAVAHGDASAHGEPEGDREQYRDFDQVLHEGINAFYRSDWQQARKLFRELQRKDDSDLRPFFFDAMVPFWKYFFAGEDEAAAGEFLKISETALEVGQRRMNAQPHDTTVVLMMGGLHGYRGLVAAAEKQYRTAVRSGVDGYGFSRRLMNMNADNPDALIGQGVYNYMVGSVPREVRWLTSLMGLRGDRHKGLQKLEEASATSAHTASDARIILTYLYLRENRYHDAVRVVEPLTEKWPDNLIFRYYLALALDKKGNKEAALKHYRLLSGSDHDELAYLVIKSRERVRDLQDHQEL